MRAADAIAQQAPDQSEADTTFESAEGDVTLEPVHDEVLDDNIAEEDDFEVVINMTNYDESNAEDATDVHTRLYQLKSQYKFNKSYLRFWFTQFEARLQCKKTMDQTYTVNTSTY